MSLCFLCKLPSSLGIVGICGARVCGAHTTRQISEIWRKFPVFGYRGTVQLFTFSISNYSMISTLAI